MAELDEFRAETRAWLEANCPAEMRTPMRGEKDICWGGRRLDVPVRRPAPVARRDGAARLDRPRLAQGIWRRRPVAGRGQGAQGGNARDRRAAAADQLRHLDARSGPSEIRQRGAEDALPARDRARRDPLVPGLFGAGRGKRPRRAADQVRGSRRSLAGQWPEGVDQLCRRGRLDLLPGAHVERVQARRDQLPAVRHGLARTCRPGRSC